MHVHHLEAPEVPRRKLWHTLLSKSPVFHLSARILEFSDRSNEPAKEAEFGSK